MKKKKINKSNRDDNKIVDKIDGNASVSDSLSVSQDGSVNDQKNDEIDSQGVVDKIDGNVSVSDSLSVSQDESFDDQKNDEIDSQEVVNSSIDMNDDFQEQNSDDVANFYENNNEHVMEENQANESSVNNDLSLHKSSSNHKILLILFCLIGFIFILSFILFRKSIYFNYSEQDFVFDVGSNYSNPIVSACYGNKFKCKSIDVSVDSDVDISTIGVYKVTYTAKSGSHVKKLVKDVSIVDREKPVIETDSDSLSVCPNASSYDVLYKAYDNYDGDITSNVSQDTTDDSLILSVSDSSNNVVTKNISLIREDLAAPSITLSGNQTVYVPINSTYSEAGYSAVDNCDGDVTSNVTVSGSVDTSKAGTYDITYSVSDSLSNSTTVTRKVNVYAPNGDGSKVIYLTFDDGPSVYTGELLGILARYNVKATFFVTNISSNYSYYIKQAYEQGHSIALHTSSHNYSRIYSSIDAYFNDLNEINETVKSMTGSYSNLLRFPGGSSNTVSRRYSSGIMSQLSTMVQDRGFKYFDWNVSSGDADGRVHSSEEYANNIINGLGNGSYYIVLQHDTNINSIRSVGTVIEYGLSHGYTFKALDYSSPVVHHKIAN